ncbi:hypothetical protein L0F63_006452, partial [Massospora cicadina]
HLTLVTCRILPECSGKMQIRKNLRDMNKVEIERYFSAVKKLNSGTRPTRWDMYANIHKQHYQVVHNSPIFLAWHRMMLFAIERDLQVHDPNVTIPYWDWTLFSQRPQRDPVLSDRLFGGNGNRRTGCLVNGQFKKFSVFYWHSGQEYPHCLTRKSNIFQRPFTSTVAIDRNYLDLDTIDKFAEAIEFVPHLIIHNSLGREFSGYASPGDPLFYSHHAFVDKLWFDWQNRHSNSYFNYPLSYDRQMMPWTVPIGEVIDPVSSLCYRYPEDGFKYEKRSFAFDFTFEKYLPPTSANQTQLLQYDKQYILNSLSQIPKGTLIKNPDPLPLEFISRMGFDLAKIREQERKDALLNANFTPNQCKF